MKTAHHSLMFPFITKTWNPLGGRCNHNCTYCYAKDLIKFHVMEKFTGEPRLYDSELTKKFKADDFVFVSSMCDLFGHWVTLPQIQQVLNKIALSAPAKFLLLTKNPERYFYFKLPENTIAGVTIESDINWDVSDAPDTTKRLFAITDLKHPKMISIEPIMRFSSDFAKHVIEAKPDFVAVGYDNHTRDLPEPSLEETENLIHLLEMNGIKVYRKTIRVPFNGKNTTEEKQ